MQGKRERKKKKMKRKKDLGKKGSKFHPSCWNATVVYSKIVLSSVRASSQVLNLAPITAVMNREVRACVCVFVCLCVCVHRLECCFSVHFKRSQAGQEMPWHSVAPITAIMNREVCACVCVCVCACVYVHRPECCFLMHFKRSQTGQETACRTIFKLSPCALCLFWKRSK